MTKQLKLVAGRDQFKKDYYEARIKLTKDEYERLKGDSLAQEKLCNSEVLNRRG